MLPKKNPEQIVRQGAGSHPSGLMRGQFHKYLTPGFKHPISYNLWVLEMPKSGVLAAKNVNLHAKISGI